MERDLPGWTLSELANRFQGDLVGPSDLIVNRAVPADGVDEHGLTFAESEEYLRKAALGGVAAVLAPRGATPMGKPTIFVDNPRMCFGMFLAMTARPLPIASGIHPTAVVSEQASVAASAQIGPYAVVERGATIGENCRIYPYCYVGEYCELGEGTVLNPSVILYQDVVLGKRCIIHSGVVLGADGFGFTWNGERHVKVPQVGGVRLGDDVEIGANSSVDRATAGDTLVGDGTKLDNLVQIGHNARLGKHGVIASQTGLGGSTEIGDRVTIAGQVAVTDHAVICDDVTLAGRAGIMNDIKEPGTYFGLPGRPLAEAMRILKLYTMLPELFKRLKDLERRLPPPPPPAGGSKPE